MANILLTPQTMTIALGLIDKFMDNFRADEQIILEYTSPDYERVTILWGLFEWEQGCRKTITIQGPKGFCNAVLKELESNRGMLKMLAKEKIR